MTTIKTIALRTSTFAAALLAMTAGASALTLDVGIRNISARFVDAAGTEIANQSDSEIVTNGATYQNNLSVFIGSSNRFEASVGMSIVGAFGIAARASQAGTLTTRVSLLETYVNDQSTPVDLSATFVVVDGAMFLVAGDNGTLTYDLGVGTFPFGEFNGRGVLEGNTANGFFASFSESGDSLGATQANVGDAVDIPFSVHTIDLGRIEPGASLDYFYDIEIVMDATALEIASWQFVDPSATLPLPALSTVSARPAGGAPSAAVPLPATLPLLVGALGGLALAARRRRAA